MSATRTDGSKVWGEGESLKTGSNRKQERLEALVDWLLTPESEREPKTKKGFADEHGVSYETIRTDLREPFVQRELVSRARSVARVDRLPQIMEALYNITQGKNADGEVKHNRFGEVVFPSPGATVSAANTILSWMDQTREIREGDARVSELTDEQLVEAALRLLNSVKEVGPGSGS